MHDSPDCRRMETARYPDSRGYAGNLEGSPIPIAGEYLEIPSTTGNTSTAELSTAADGACDVPADAVGNSGLALSNKVRARVSDRKYGT